MLMATAATLGHYWPEYNEYDLRDAEHKYLRAESQHVKVYYSLLPQAQHIAHNDPEYKRLRQARFDIKIPSGGSLEKRMAQRRQIRDSLFAKADSIKEQIITDYMEADSAYVATRQNMAQASDHLDFVRAEVRRADSISKLPQHKIMWHNIKETFQKKR